MFYADGKDLVAVSAVGLLLPVVHVHRDKYERGDGSRLSSQLHP